MVVGKEWIFRKFFWILVLVLDFYMENIYKNVKSDNKWFEVIVFCIIVDDCLVKWILIN